MSAHYCSRKYMDECTSWPNGTIRLHGGSRAKWLVIEPDAAGNIRAAKFGEEVFQNGSWSMVKNPLVVPAHYVQIELPKRSEETPHEVFLPDFVPIEERFPDWPEARSTFQRYAPGENSIRFVSIAHDEFGIDWSWAFDLIDATPTGHKYVVQMFLSLVEREFATWDTAEVYARFLGQCAEPSTVNAATTLLQQRDQVRKSYGWPMLHQMIAHLLGLQPNGVMGYYNMHIKVTP